MAQDRRAKTTKESWPLRLRLSFTESSSGPHEAPVNPLNERAAGVAPGDPLPARKGTYSLHLADDRGFPPLHEFSLDWLLEQTGRGFVSMSADEITLTLANGRAVYTIDRSRMESSDGKRLSHGYWGVLKEGKTTRG